MSLEKASHVLDFRVGSNILGVVGEVFEDDLQELQIVAREVVRNEFLSHRFVVDRRQDDGFLDGSDHNLP